MSQKEAEGDKYYKKAEKLVKPSVMSMRIKADWDQAGPLYEQAATCFKQASSFVKARDAFEKAAVALEKKGSPWHAAKHMESAAQAAAESRNFDDVVLLVEQASIYYLTAGKGPTSCECLARGAKLLEPHSSKHSVSLYEEALEGYEREGRQVQANDVYKNVVALYVKSEQYDDGCEALMRYASACEAAGMSSSVAKCYLGCLVLRLYSQAAAQAWQEYQDFLAVPSFSTSDEAFAAESLFDAYRSGDANLVKGAVQQARVFTTLDPSQGRLARKLPQGDLKAQASQLGQQEEDIGQNEDDDFT